MTNHNTSNKRIAKNTIFLSIRMVVVLTITLFTTRIVLKALGIVDYGVYNVVGGFVALFAFLNTSLSNGIQRFFNYEYGKNGEQGTNRVFCTAIYIQALLSLVVFVLIEPIGQWYLHNKMVIPIDRMMAAEWIFQLSIMAFIFGIMTAPFSAAVTAHQRFDFYALISILDSLLKLAIAYLVLLCEGSDKLIIYAVLLAGISVFNILIYYFYCTRNFEEIRFHLMFDKSLFWKMLGFSGWNLFGTFSNVLENQGMNLVLNFFFGPVVNAARGVAVQVNGAIHGFVGNITTPVRPQVVQSYASGNLRRALNLTFSVSKITGVIEIMLAIPIALEIDFILQLWLGENVPKHTAAFTILVIATTLFNSLQSPLSGLVHATGRMKKYQLCCSIVRLSAIPLSILLLKYIEFPEIAFWVVFILSILVLFVSLIIIRQLIGLDMKRYLSSVVFPLLCLILLSLFILVPIRMIACNHMLRLVLLSFMSIILVCCLSYYIVFEKNERQIALQMILSFKKKINIG